MLARVLRSLLLQLVVSLLHRVLPVWLLPESPVKLLSIGLRRNVVRPAELGRNVQMRAELRVVDREGQTSRRIDSHSWKRGGMWWRRDSHTTRNAVSMLVDVDL